MNRLNQYFQFFILISLLAFLLLAIKTNTIAESPIFYPYVGSGQDVISSSTQASMLSSQIENVEMIGQIGGPTLAVFVQLNYAYIGVGPRLVIIDMANPANPIVKGKTEPLPGIVQDIYLSGSYAYVASGHGGLRVVNVSNPANPYQVGGIDSSGFASGVVVASNYAYVADGRDGLRVVDISNPTNPQEVGGLDTPGSAAGVDVAGSYAYVADLNRGLRVINIATPSEPTEVGSLDAVGSAKDVAVKNNYAYVADESQGLRVINISNPANPQEVGSVDTPRALGVEVTDRYAYVADHDSGLLLIDISSPTNPQIVAELGRRGISSTVAVAGGYAYLATDYRGLRVINIANAANPQEVGVYDPLGPTQGVTMAGNFAYLADGRAGLGVVDISNPANPQEVAQLNTTGESWQVAVVGGVAYLADGSNGLRVIDISTPDNPTAVGEFNPSGYEYTKGVAVASGMAYVADLSFGLRVLDISNPANPQQVGTLSMSGGAQSVTVAGNYAYLANGSGGLWVVNISSPTNPIQVGLLDTAGIAYSVAVAGNHAYVADSTALRVINISNPTNPQEVGALQIAGTAQGVTIAQNYAYVADGSGWLRVVNISTPTNPIEVDGFDTPGEAFGVAVAGGYTYMADGSGGLLILRYIPSNLTPTPIPTATATPTPQVVQDSYEPDDTCAEARAISTDGVVQPHTFHTARDVDWISFSATSDNEYIIEALTSLHSEADVVLELYDRCDAVPNDGQNNSFSPDVRLRFNAPTSNTYYIKLTNTDLETGGPNVTYDLSVRELANNANPGALILVAGRLRDSDSLQDNIHDVTHQVYKLFAAHGYSDDRIYYLSTEDRGNQYVVDALPNQANLQAAITQWAVGKVGSEQALTLYLMDHGGIDRFYLNGSSETINPDQLDNWLGELEAAVPGVRINVIVEACHSGSFIDLNKSISRQGRVIITSTGAFPLAYSSQKGAVFSDAFVGALNRGMTVYGAFVDARQAAITAHSDQTAWLDDNGDGLYTAADGNEAQRRGFAYSGTFSKELWPPYIAQAEIDMITDSEGMISADVRDDRGVDHVWAIIYPPSYTPPDTNEEVLPEETLESINLLDNDGDGIYTARHRNFDEPGTYRIVLYADDEDNLQARPREMRTGDGLLYLPITIRR